MFVLLGIVKELDGVVWLVVGGRFVVFILWLFRICLINNCWSNWFCILIWVLCFINCLVWDVRFDIFVFGFDLLVKSLNENGIFVGVCGFWVFWILFVKFVLNVDIWICLFGIVCCCDCLGGIVWFVGNNWKDCWIGISCLLMIWYVFWFDGWRLNICFWVFINCFGVWDVDKLRFCCFVIVWDWFGEGLKDICIIDCGDWKGFLVLLIIVCLLVWIVCVIIGVGVGKIGFLIFVFCWFLINWNVLVFVIGICIGWVIVLLDWMVCCCINIFWLLLSWNGCWFCWKGEMICWLRNDWICWGVCCIIMFGEICGCGIIFWIGVCGGVKWNEFIWLFISCCCWCSCCNCWICCCCCCNCWWWCCWWCWICWCCCWSENVGGCWLIIFCCGNLNEGCGIICGWCIIGWGIGLIFIVFIGFGCVCGKLELKRLGLFCIFGMIIVFGGNWLEVKNCDDGWFGGCDGGCYWFVMILWFLIFEFIEILLEDWEFDCEDVEGDGLEGGELCFLLNKFLSWLMVFMIDLELDWEEFCDFDFEDDEFDCCEFFLGFWIWILSLSLIFGIFFFSLLINWLIDEGNRLRFFLLLSCLFVFVFFIGWMCLLVLFLGCRCFLEDILLLMLCILSVFLLLCDDDFDFWFCKKYYCCRILYYDLW